MLALTPIQTNRGTFGINIFNDVSPAENSIQIKYYVVIKQLLRPQDGAPEKTIPEEIIPG